MYVLADIYSLSKPEMNIKLKLLLVNNSANEAIDSYLICKHSIFSWK
jgi:hypothetical protein